MNILNSLEAVFEQTHAALDETLVEHIERMATGATWSFESDAEVTGDTLTVRLVFRRHADA